MESREEVFRLGMILDDVIVDRFILNEGFMYRDGFVFTYGQKNPAVFDRIVVRVPHRTRANERRMGYSSKTLEEHIELINRYQIKRVLAICNDLTFISSCPSIEDIIIALSYDAPASFDYSPLYKHPNIQYMSCSTVYGVADQYATTIDYTEMPQLKGITISGKGHIGYGKLNSLERISISNVKTLDSFQRLLSSNELKQVTTIMTSLKSLDGIGVHTKLTSLVMYNNYSINDISALKEVKHSLTELVIENCGKIRDFSVLEQLENLEYLQLYGNNMLPNLNFLRNMKKIKVFSFTMNVADGNLTPCMHLQYASCRDRKHFNLKDSELPKTIL